MNAYPPLPAILHQPVTVEAACSLLLGNPGAVPIAGGQHLVPRWRDTPWPRSLVSLRSIESLRQIDASETMLSLGAAVTLQELADSSIVQHRLPTLSQLAGRMGDRLLRNRATVAGALCTTSSSGCLPAAMLGLGATLLSTERTIDVDDWFLPGGPSGLRRGELITKVLIPLPEATSHQWLRPIPGRFAWLTVFASRGPAGWLVGVTGLAAHAFRATQAEAWLARSTAPGAPAPDDVFDRIEVISDVRADARYRLAQARRLLLAVSRELGSACSV